LFEVMRRKLQRVAALKVVHFAPSEKVYSLQTSHSPFFSTPKELVDILLFL